MKLVIQRVKDASVTVDARTVGAVGPGMMVLVGIETGDTEADCDRLVAKTTALRIFDDENGVMNKSIIDAGGNILAISQFTLLADCRKGNRPSYIRAARPEQAVPLYDRYCAGLESALGRPVARGIFGADMKVSLINDGPVTILLESRDGAIL